MTEPLATSGHVTNSRHPAQKRYLNVNGETIHVLDQGSGPAVLFCHGFPDTAETWRSQLRAVSEAGYRAVALDMRGFGESYAPHDVDLYTSVHVAGDLTGVLDTLDITEAVLVGHDWGADYAQRAAVMRPDRFRAVVSLSIPFAPRGEVSLWEQLRSRGLEKRYYSMDFNRPNAETQFRPAAQTIPSILYWLSASPKPQERWNPIEPALGMVRPSPVATPDWADPAYVRHTIAAFEKTGFDTGLNYYRAVQKTFDITAAFKNAVIQQPSLYIWGAADGLCRFFHPETPPLEELRKTQPNLIGQVRLDNAGHWIQHEAAEQLNIELVRFLKNIS
jgi:pimeloyl-ACP methyl ester carboxylesterase